MSELHGIISTGTKNCEIKPIKRFRRGFFHLVCGAKGLYFFADRPGRSEQLKVTHRKIPFFKKSNNFLANSTGGPYDSYAILFQFDSMMESYKFYIEETGRLKLERTDVVLVASIPRQMMYLYKGGEAVKAYVISTSKLPPSCKENSLGTPWGMHQVSEVIGSGQPEGTVFKGRKSTGACYWEFPSEDQLANLITSRILRLTGLEEEVNLGGEVDTFARYVYIHGTNHEEKLGSPASSGCIQVSNACAVELAGLVPTGSHLLISQK